MLVPAFICLDMLLQSYMVRPQYIVSPLLRLINCGWVDTQRHRQQGRIAAVAV